jgi:exonuclease III
MDKISKKKKKIILAGDFNGKIGNQPIAGCIGTHGKQVTNHNGAALRDFCAFNKLKISNSFYRQKDLHKFTSESRGTKSLIDYIIINDRFRSNIKDTRVFSESEIDSDHKLVESKFKFCTQAKQSQNKTDKTIYQTPPAFTVHLLKQESIRTPYRNRVNGKLTPLSG